MIDSTPFDDLRLKPHAEIMRDYASLKRRLMEMGYSRWEAETCIDTAVALKLLLDASLERAQSRYT